MTTVQLIRHSQVWEWTLICLLAMLLVLAVLTRVAGATSDEPPAEPVTTYIVSPSSGMFVAGSYRGAEPYVSIGSRLELGTVVGNVEVWGRLHPVYSMVRGTIVEVLVFDDALILPKQPLFKVQIETEPMPT
jgi:acetyl-CoA carboxylase biotin carboxyl carrier protein